MKKVPDFEFYYATKDGLIYGTLNKPMKFETYKGYYRIGMRKYGKQKHYSVHRIIAQTFIPNPDNKPIVNHINGIKTDNRVENLEWVTASENQLHAYKTGLNDNVRKINRELAKTRTGAKSWSSKKVIDTFTGKIYDSVALASIPCGIHKSYLSQMLRGDAFNKTSMKYL